MKGVLGSLVVVFLSGGFILAQAEKQCDDGIDNDGDGLIDCADPNCRKACASGGEGAVLPQGCTPGQIAKVDVEGQWVCAGDEDTVGALFCSDEQIARFNGVSWNCGADQVGTVLPACSAGQIPVADGSGGWLCCDPPPTTSRLVLLDSLGQEIGLVLDRIDVQTTVVPRYFPVGVKVAAEATGAMGEPVLALFNASSSAITGNIQGLNDETDGIGVEVFFADAGCTDAYIQLHPSVPVESMVTALTAASASPGGVCCETAPATTLFVAELGQVVTIPQPFFLNDWGGCFEVGSPLTGLPATARIDISGFVPPFKVAIR